MTSVSFDKNPEVGTRQSKPRRPRPLKYPVLQHSLILSVGAATTFCSRGRKNQCRKSRATQQSETDHQNKRAQVQGSEVVRGEARAERRRDIVSPLHSGETQFDAPVFSVSSVSLFSSASQRLFEPAESKTALEHFNKRDAGFEVFSFNNLIMMTNSYVLNLVKCFKSLTKEQNI